jgi:ABC-type dipeptide/oligopeptide/nickel transport system permease subunit
MSLNLGYPDAELESSLPVVVTARAPGRLRETVASILRQRSAIIGLVILVSFALVAILADQLSPFHPQQDFLGEPGARPRAAPCIHALGCPAEYQEHWFGLDGNGRDLYTRVIHGTRISLFIGFLTVGVAFLVGAVLGAIAGYAGGRLDTLIMRLMDVLLVFPALILAIAIVTVVGSGLIQAAVAIGLVSIPVYARIMRASVITAREQDFVTASRALGESPTGLLLRRVLPNSLTAILVAGTLGIGSAVLDIAALSFLGLGADIRTPEWGAMIGNESSNVFSSPHLLLFPGIALTLTVLAYNLFGDGLRDALDPRLHR